MEKDVHTEHCCEDHGCKYSDVNCTVTSGRKKQSFRCEICVYDDERTQWIEPIVRGFFGASLQPVIIDALIEQLVLKAKEVL